jgi:hypothetical protein
VDAAEVAAEGPIQVHKRAPAGPVACLRATAPGPCWRLARSAGPRRNSPGPPAPNRAGRPHARPWDQPSGLAFPSRRLAVQPALPLGGLDFPAGQRRGLKGALTTELRLSVRLSGGRRLRPCRRSLLFRPLLPHVEPSSRNYSPSGAVLCSPFWRQALLFSAVRVVPARRWVSQCRSSWCSILLRLGAIPGRSGVNMRGVVLAVVVLLAVLPLGSQLGKPVPVSVVTDWSSRHVLFPQSKSISKAAATSPPSRSGSRC